MRRCVVFATYLLMSAGIAFAQSTETSAQSSASAPNTASGNALHGSFVTTLVKGVDSKKLKNGDQVICQTAGPIQTRTMLIPSGSKIIGHVTQATARDKGDSNSTLGIVFDKIEISKGKEFAMKGTLQSVSPGIGNTAPDIDIGGSNMGKEGGAGGRMGAGSIADPGRPNPIPARNSSLQPTPGPGQTPTGGDPVKSGSQLTSQSEGVRGYRDLSMDNNSLLSSTGKEVKLNNGTQIVVRAEIEVPTP